jgi:DNA mismatch endonuclease (patch repair protein)
MNFTEVTTQRYPAATSEAVSKVMKGNRKADTRPEVLLRSALHDRGRRFFKNRRVSVAGISVRPDILFPTIKVAVFVDGCFWHRCPEHGNLPRGPNAEYWRRKLQGNVERDRRDGSLLSADGWFVLRFWEHEEIRDCVKSIEWALDRLSKPADTR